jgi:hypothetical protein
VRFDLSGVHQYSGAVITKARLMYADQIVQLQAADGSVVGDPYDVNHDAVWGSCAAQIGVPNDDWRGQSGLVPSALDDTLGRLDRVSWDVTNQARHWYYDPDYLNTGLMLRGYDEGTDYSNDAACISVLSEFKLHVDFVGEDLPTPVPTLPDFVVGAVGHIAPTPTPKVSPQINVVATSTPTPPSMVAVGPPLPALVISRVETNSTLPSGLTVACAAGRGTTFTVRVKNAGNAASTDFAMLSLSIDGTARATSTVDPLAPGAEKAASIGGIVLGAGTHSFTVTVNGGDGANQTFINDHLVCR